MAEFPLDLTSQILRLLPVSTLLRFKCVSKTFFSIIDGPDFIKLHLNTNFEHKTHRKIVFQNYPNLDPLYVLDINNPVQPLPDFLLKPSETNYDSDIEYAESDSGDSNDQTSPSHEDSDGENSHTDEDSGSEDSNNQVSNTFYSPFFAHCNGLVLIGERDMSRFGVWNPSTRKYWKIPYHRDHWVKDCSFGYDPSTDDYKVLIVNTVRFCPYCDDCTDSRRPEFWILGLRSGCWKKIERNYPFSYYEDWMAKDIWFVDGAFYFTSEEQCSIHSIDVLEEKFSRVSLPNDIKKTDFVSSLQVFEGCLCAGIGCMKMNRRDLFDDDDDDDDDEEDGTEKLYVRKKNDKGEFFWTKLLSFGWEDIGLNIIANPYMDRRLGYLKGRDKVFIFNSGDGCELYFYDYEEKSTERVVNGYMKNNVQAIFCVESLVCLDYLTKKEEDDDDEANWVKSRHLMERRYIG